jgi:hypothetical protein
MSIKKISVLMIQRAECYSPDSVTKDKAILETTGEGFRKMGMEVVYMKEEQMADMDEMDFLSFHAIVHMCRSRYALQLLQKASCPVINAPMAVTICNSRVSIDNLMRQNGIACAPVTGEEGYWVKSDTGHNVVFVQTREEAFALSNSMKTAVVTAHVRGENVKFYGVGQRFFHPDGYSTLCQEAIQLAHLTGAEVWGGDAIVRPDGSVAIVDFNDWPSFSTCLNTAADAIVQHVLEKTGGL